MIVANWIRLRPSSPLIIRLPARIKNGKANMGKDCVGANICWATTISGGKSAEATAAPDAMTNTCPTGTAKNSSRKKEIGRASVKGKSAAGRVDLGGRRNNNK